MLIHSTIKA